MRPTSRPARRQLNEYNYFRRNVAGVQREWWFHRSGCRAWFVADRDTRTNEVHWTALPGDAPPNAGGDDDDAHAGPCGSRGMSRLPVQPGERIDRRAPIAFTFDGKTIPAFEGDTIASALYASGRRTFSRSFKYHRPRGELCGCGQCANSLVQIGGRPGVRALRRTGDRRDRGRAHEREARPGFRRDARDGHRRRPVHAAGLLLQDVHPSAAAVAAVREGAALRGRSWRAAQAPGRPRVAHRVPPASLRRARDRRRHRRADRRAARRRAGRRRRALRRGHRARRGAALRGRARASTRVGRPRARGRCGDPLQCAGARVLRRARASLAGRARCTRSARTAISPRPAHSSSHSCSPTTTYRA